MRWILLHTINKERTNLVSLSCSLASQERVKPPNANQLTHSEIEGKLERSTQILHLALDSVVATDQK